MLEDAKEVYIMKLNLLCIRNKMCMKYIHGLEEKIDYLLKNKQ